MSINIDLFSKTPSYLPLTETIPPTHSSVNFLKNFSSLPKIPLPSNRFILLTSCSLLAMAAIITIARRYFQPVSIPQSPSPQTQTEKPHPLPVPRPELTQDDMDLSILTILQKIEQMFTETGMIHIFPLFKSSINSISQHTTTREKAEAARKVIKQHSRFFSSIQNISLDHLGLTCIPSEIKYFRSLYHLSLKGNKIHTLPTEFKELQKLQHLNLSKNSFDQFPQELTALKNLTSLDLSENTISSLPNSISKLTNLSDLKLNDCVLSRLPKGLCTLTKLRILELKRNHLQTLPEEIKQLTKLCTLHVEGNGMQSVPRYDSLKDLDDCDVAIV